LGRLINYEAPGTALDDGYEYGVEVAGIGLIDVEITTPWGQTVAVNEFVPADWEFGDYIEGSRGPLGAENYNIGEHPLAGGEVTDGQTATIGLLAEQERTGLDQAANVNG